MNETLAENIIKWVAIVFLILFGGFLSYSGLTGDDAGAGGFGMISVLVGVSNAVAELTNKHHH